MNEKKRKKKQEQQQQQFRDYLDITVHSLRAFFLFKFYPVLKLKKSTCFH